MSPDESRIALLELQVRQLEARQKHWKSDVWSLLGAGLILFPMVFRQVDALRDESPLVGMVAALMLVGFGAYLRDRRDDRRAAAERQQIFLSISPSKPNP
jgi:hypothetical protein